MQGQGRNVSWLNYPADFKIFQTVSARKQKSSELSSQGGHTNNDSKRKLGKCGEMLSNYFFICFAPLKTVQQGNTKHKNQSKEQ